MVHIAVSMNGDYMKLNKQLCDSYTKKMELLSDKYKTDGDEGQSVAYKERGNKLKQISDLVKKNIPKNLKQRVTYFYPTMEDINLNAKICLIYKTSIEKIMNKYKDVDDKKYEKARNRFNESKKLITSLGASVNVKEELFA
jgi:hypothetical protein